MDAAVKRAIIENAQANIKRAKYAEENDTEGPSTRCQGDIVDGVCILPPQKGDDPLVKVQSIKKMVASKMVASENTSSGNTGK